MQRCGVAWLGRVIGLPPESDWPDDTPVPWSSFKISRHTPLEKLLPNMEPEALDLMKVNLCGHSH